LTGVNRNASSFQPQAAAPSVDNDSIELPDEVEDDEDDE
jgi:hypothetical protein